MNHIGQKIKELRRKNDLTQEKLADFLGVTYQSVSKWECGTTMPDLALIVPLARVLGVTTDELLGMKPVEADERKVYFDAEFFQHWKKDHARDLEIARQAVAEYPGDCRYLYWLASDEWYVGCGDECMGTDEETELLTSAVRHYEMVLEHCEDAELRRRTLFGLVHACRDLGQYDDARTYAGMVSEAPESTREDALMLCLQGEELKTLYKKRIMKALVTLNGALSQLWYYEDEPCEEALNAEEAAIKAVITDGNYQHFHISLAMIWQERARMAMRNGDSDAAVRALETAMEHAKQYDTMAAEGMERYTCPILDDYCEDHRADRKDEDWSMMGAVREFSDRPVFDALRDRDDFKAIYG